MKITTGTFKGSVLTTPPSIRATSTKVRQAFCNILAAVLPGARVLDGFAGSGAVGCEALSRGAAFVAFLESDPQAIVAIQENVARLGVQLPRAAWRLVQFDIERGLRQVAMVEPPFNVIFLDPPYRSEEGKKALNVVVDCGMLAPTGMLVIEHERRMSYPASVGPLQQCTQHRYGDTVLSFYQHA